MGLPEGTGKRYSGEDIESFIAASPTHKTKWQEFEEMCREFDELSNYLDSMHTTIPRIIAPGVAFCRTYKPVKSLTDDELAELHEMLFTGSRFMIQRVIDFHNAVFNSTEAKS